MIHVEGLSKIYRVHKRAPGLMSAVRSLWRRECQEKRAVHDLSFKIAPGKIVGFLGPNGAGKTTTLKLLTGILHPDGGRAEVFGHTPHARQDEFLRQIGFVMGQKGQLIWELPAADYYEMLREIYTIPRDQFRRTLAELAEMLGVQSLLGTQVKRLSLGERMKCELIASLLHRPRILFLDEPTIGLDILSQRRVREFIMAYNRTHGATVILTSHYMADIEACCDRVLLIDRGSLRYDGPASGLAARYGGGRRVRLEFTSAPDERMLRSCGRLVSLEGTVACLEVEAPLLRAAISRILAEHDVTDFTVEEPSLEDAFEGALAEATA